MAKEALKKMINVDEFDEFGKELEQEIYGDVSLCKEDLKNMNSDVIGGSSQGSTYDQWLFL